MRQHLALASFIAALIFAGSTTLYFGGLDPANFPRTENAPQITPAVYTFSIWIVIFLWLIIGTFLQWRLHAMEKAWAGLRLPLIISMLAGAFWSWTYFSDAKLAFVIMLVMWLGAVWALFVSPPTGRWIGLYPIGLYTGWMSAAIGVSTGAGLVDSGFVPDPLAAIIGIIVGAALALFAIARAQGAMTVAVAVIFGLAGIIVNNLTPGGSLLVIITAAVGVVMISGYAVIQWREAAALWKLTRN